MPEILGIKKYSQEPDPLTAMHEGQHFSTSSILDRGISSEMNSGRSKLVTIHLYSYIIIQGHGVISHNSSNLSPFAVFIIIILLTPPVF
jgi:hypothetical protein